MFHTLPHRTATSRMHRAFTSVVVVAAVAGIAPGTAAAAARPSSGEPPVALQVKLDELVAAGVPGVVVLARNGEATEQLAAGVSEVEVATAMTTETRFRTGSVAKTFVATVVMQLSDEGVLSLEDTVEAWLPGLVDNGTNITIVQLLGNRSGLFEFAEDPRVLQPYIDGDLGYVWEPRDLVEVSNEHEPNFAPGTAARYSNTDYTLLGLIIEAATSRSVSDEVLARIVDPLGLAATDVPTTAELTAPYAHGYYVSDGFQDVTNLSPSFSSFGGNLVSTAADLATFYDALFAGELIPMALVTDMLAVTTAGDGEQLGLGLQVLELPCGTFAGHSGSTPGYKAAAFNDLEHDRQFVILANSLTLDDQVGNAAAAQAFDELAVLAACG